MIPLQAVHYRVGRLAAGNESVAALVTTMFGVLGGPFRLFEMMGLQQPWRYHVLNTLLYMVLHPWASADGIRCACLVLPWAGGWCCMVEAPEPLAEACVYDLMASWAEPHMGWQCKYSV